MTTTRRNTGSRRWLRTGAAIALAAFLSLGATPAPHPAGAQAQVSKLLAPKNTPKPPKATATPKATSTPKPSASQTPTPSGVLPSSGPPATPTPDPTTTPQPDSQNESDVEASPQPPRIDVDVTDHGAAGDGKTNDSQAIQAAADAVSAQGGGVVHFPPGVYLASDIRQGSYVELRGEEGAVLKHPDGVSSEPIVRTPTLRSTGSIQAGSRVLQVDDTSKILPGAVVAVRGAGGAAPYQFSALSADVGAADDSMVINWPKGFSTGAAYRPNHLLIGDEIVAYWWLVGTDLLGVQRGLYGTQASSHPAGARISQLQVLYALVESVEADHVVLDRPAAFGVTNSVVNVGSVGMKVTGLTFDGNRPAGHVARAGRYPVLYQLARHAVVANNTFRNTTEQGTIRFDQGTRDSAITNNLVTNSDGGAIWLFRGASSNTVSANRIEGRTNHDNSGGIYIDDRTDASTEFDADSRDNLVEDNVIINAVRAREGVAIYGSSNNVVRNNTIEGTNYGVRMYTGGQSTVAPPTSNNLVTGNSLTNHHFCIWVDGSENLFEGNRLSSCTRFIVNWGGTTNRFVDNVVVS